MNIRCPHCQTVFRIDPARVPERGVRARCARCSGIFRVEPPSPTSGLLRGEPGTMAEGRPAHAAPVETSASEHRDASSVPQPAQPVHPAEQEGGERTAPEPAVVPDSTAESAQAPAADADEPPGQEQEPTTGPSHGAGAVSEPGTAHEPAPAQAGEPQAEPEQVQVAEPQTERPPTPEAEAAPVQSAVESAAPSETAGERVEDAVQPAASARRVPSFIGRDPEARAKRLARALVSDIVAYHPDRVERTLAAGSLRAEFRDEIMKSWEEYVAQVGMERAKSTPYFREALNEILARGRKVF
jgi:predicted Zn finger-like uncharacterized protein